MKHQFRKLLIGLAGAGLALAPLAITELANMGAAGAAVSADTAQYLQPTNGTNTGYAFKFVPGDGSAVTTQALSLVGHDDFDGDLDDCATPTASGSPLISLSALYYNHPVGGVPYTGSASTSKPGAYKGATGACGIAPETSVSVKESLTFAVGTNPLVAGRQLSRATLSLKRADKCSDKAITASLIERQGATVVGTQNFTISGGAGTLITADTGTIAGGFTSVELRVASSSQGGSVSVVGPAATLTFVKLNQTISFTNTPPTSPSVGDTYTAAATATSGLAVTLSVDAASTSGCSVNPATGLVTLSGPAGTCVIDADQPGDSTYFAAPQAQQSVGVGLAPQDVSFDTSPPVDPQVGQTYQANAFATSGLPVAYSIDPSSTSGCTVDSSTGLVSFADPPGTCVINANQDGDESYAPGSAQQSFTVYELICGQQTIDTASTDGSASSGEISAELTFKDFDGQPAPTDVCKEYSAFTASTNDPVPAIGGSQSVNFESSDLPTAHVVVTITWAYDGFCTPDGSGGSTICPPTYVSTDHGATWAPQTYCISAQAAGLPWCTTGKSYSFSASGTQITETWDGYGDPIFHKGTG